MDKKLLIAIGLSLATVWAFNYYSAKKIQPQQINGGTVTVGQQADITPGQPVKVLTSQELFKPLAMDVDFAEKKLTTPEQILTIQTDYCTATLSNYGAIVTSLDFKKHPGKTGAPLRTIFNKGTYEEEQRKKGCFLLALDQQTPYIYKLVSNHTEGKKTFVEFSTETESWTIFKTYIFHLDSYQMDLDLRFEPKATATLIPLKPRIFFASPYVAEIADDNVSIFAWNDAQQKMDITEPAQTKDLAWHWTQPKPLFGAEDRYFAHALINDPARFVQRAYVKQFDTKNIFPILEGPTVISGKSEWQLSFYMGPKLSDHLNQVDDRLEDLLSFGWLSWLCKLLLKLLALIHTYIGNFGLAIIVMTIVLKLPFTPLSIYSRKKMEVYQHYLPSINKIRTKYRQDLKMQQEELMKFYHDHNISPSAHLVGCLPLLIQMPILFALYRVLNNYLDLYQAPFFGWIVDLSAKDPYYIIPIVMGLTMLWQQHLTPSTDGKQRFIMFFMSIVMTVLFANFPAGLVLYWLVNNVFSIGEDYLRKYLFS